MSLFGTQVTICGVPCAMVLRGAANGQYQAVFERERASLEEVESIDWSRPVLEGDSLLPAGCGFTVEHISYSSVNRCCTVSLKVAEQYLGDVTGFQTQVEELTAGVADRENKIQAQEAAIQEREQTIRAQAETIQAQLETIQAMEAAGTAAQVEEGLKAAYEEGVESNG